MVLTMPSYQKYLNAVIKAMHEDGGKTLQELIGFANIKKNPTNRGKLKNFLKDLKQKGYTDTDIDPTDDEIEELFVLIKTGSVNVTLKELFDFVESTGKPNTSDPPLVWRT